MEHILQIIAGRRIKVWRQDGNLTAAGVRAYEKLAMIMAGLDYIGITSTNVDRLDKALDEMIRHGW